MDKKWIQEAIKKSGALRETAQRQKLVKGEAPLTETVLGKLEAKGNTITKQRVNLARTLRKMNQ